jgi:hypothetical protein
MMISLSTFIPNYKGRGYPDWAYGFNQSNPKELESQL